MRCLGYGLGPNLYGFFLWAFDVGFRVSVSFHWASVVFQLKIYLDGKKKRGLLLDREDDNLTPHGAIMRVNFINFLFLFFHLTGCQMMGTSVIFFSPLTFTFQYFTVRHLILKPSYTFNF